MIKTIIGVVLMAGSAWANATLPTYPTEYNPGYTVPTTATSKSVCATVNITGATNASPIVITTAGHKWVTGQTVIIASVGGNTAANGTRVITKISATQFSLNGTTGNGAYTSGGTAACDYSNLQTALDAEAPAGDVTLYLNQGETYVGTTNTNTFRSGIILPTKTNTNWTVLRTWPDSNLPAQEFRVGRTHQPYLAKISNGTAGGSAISNNISCDERANYYWIKAIEMVRPIPQAEGGGFECLNGYGAGGSNPPRKWIKSITESGGVVTVAVDAGKMLAGSNSGGHALSNNVDIIFDCAQCAAIGLSGSYNVTGVSKRVVNIVGATNASPIVITTAEEQYWATGQLVDIASVGGNTAANGTSRAITRISSTQFSINGTTGNGSYTSGGTVQSKLNDQFTVSDTLTGAYVYDAADNAQLDPSAFPTHIVVEQVFVETPDFSNVAATRQAMTTAFDLSGEDIVIRQSFIDVCGTSAGEFGRGILMALDGPRRAVVENNYIAACAFSAFLDANPLTFNAIPTDITFRGNTMTRRSQNMVNRMDASSNLFRTTRTVKNIFETKAGLRVRLTGNHFSRGYPDGQSVMLHFTNRHNYVLSNQCGIPSLGIQGDGCHPANALADLIVDHNIMANMGQSCIDVIGQNSLPGSTPGINDYTSLRTDRVLIEHNLMLNCAGYPFDPRYLTSGVQIAGAAIELTAGPMNVTIRHNTIAPPLIFSSQRTSIKQYCGVADNPSNGAIMNTDGVTRTGDWTACTQGNNGANLSGKIPNFTVTDNIIWTNSSSFGPWGSSTVSGGSLLKCDRTDFDNATRVDGSATGAWHHNILVGSVGTLGGSNCDMNVIPGTQVLSTGSQVVASEAAMDYSNLSKKVYKLTPSSPGYQAASDGTDVGVNWDALYASVNAYKR